MEEKVARMCQAMNLTDNSISGFIDNTETLLNRLQIPKSLGEIEHLLNSFEIKLIKRARNKIKRIPKSSDPVVYSRATGFETLIGWLFLKDPKRLSKIFEYLECN